jgi:hypothetical protein
MGCEDVAQSYLSFSVTCLCIFLEGGHITHARSQYSADWVFQPQDHALANAMCAYAYSIGVKLINISPSERILRAVQFNTISALRSRRGSERFIKWLITPFHMDGMTPVEAMESGRWQEVAELAEDAMSKGIDKI